MAGDRKLTEGAATFYIYDNDLFHRDDDPFILWLKSEGFKLEPFGHGNAEHALYVNINSKVYTWGMAGVGLSPIVGNHAIHIDEFKEIYGIFKKYSGFIGCIYTEEEQKKYDEFQRMKPIYEERAEKEKKEYFDRNPSYEEWLNDVADSILTDPWYQEHRPDYTKEEILNDAKYCEYFLKVYYKQQDMPGQIAAEWGIITM